MEISKSDFAKKYAECGNAYEAAVYAGAPRAAAAAAGVGLLFSKAVRNRIRELRTLQSECPAEQGLRRIAFGRTNDAVRLAFAETVTPELIEQSDLYGVSEIKVGKGVVEIKFFDRLKALDALSTLEEARRSKSNAESLLSSIYGGREVSDE